MFRALLILCVAAPLAGCFDEDKAGCQNDGDCTGVRVCRQNACITPGGFSDEDLGIDPTPDPMPEANTGDILGGEACAEPGPGFGASLFVDNVALQDLAFGQTARVESIENEPGGNQVFEFALVTGGLVFIELEVVRPNVAPGARLDLEVGDVATIRYISAGLMGALELIEVRTQGGDDSELALGWCVSDTVSLPCEGVDWRIQRAGNAPSCDPIDTDCGPASRFALDVALENATTERLFPGQAVITPARGRSVLRWVADGIEFEEGCPGAEPILMEGLIMRLQP